MATMLNTNKVRAGKIINDVPRGGVSPPNLRRMFLEKGTLVWILEDGGLPNPDNPDDLWVRIKNVHQYGNLQPNTSGVVPFDCLEFGRYEGEFTTVVVHSFQQHVPVGQGGSLLQRAMEALFRGMIMDHSRLKEVGISNFLLARLQRDPGEITRQLLSFMPKEVFAVLKDGLVSAPGYSRDTFKMLEATPQRLHISKSTSGGGVYIHGYKKAKPMGVIIKNAWYLGQTQQFAERYSQHSAIIKSSNPPVKSKSHYTMAQYCEAANSGWYAIKMLDIPDTVPDRSDMLSFGEQVLILLLHSTNRSLLEVRSREDIEMRGAYFQQASALQSICQRVFAQVGWETSMPSVTGANWSMPMFEIQRREQAVWTRTLIPSTPEINQNTQMAIFRRQPTRFSTKVLEGKGQFCILDIQRPRTITWFAKTLPVRNVKDRLVQLVIEIQLGDNNIPEAERKKRGLSQTDHPTPYAIFPAVQPLSEAQWINRLCARLEYVDITDGMVKSFVLQAPNMSLARTQPTPPDSLLPALPRVAVRVWIYLERLLKIQFGPNRPAWLPRVLQARIHQWSFDFVKQQFQMSHTGQYPLPIGVPVVRTIQQNAIQMRGSTQLQIPAKYPDIRLGPLQPGYFPKRRAGCDFCFLNDIGMIPERRSHCASTQEVGDHLLTTCYNCRLYKRPCSWTPADDLENRGWTDLVFLPAATTTIRDVRKAPIGQTDVEVEELEDDDLDRGEDEEAVE